MLNKGLKGLPKSIFVIVGPHTKKSSLTKIVKSAFTHLLYSTLLHHYFGSHSLKAAELDTRVSACHICPFIMFTFFGITFHLKIV